MEGISSLYRLSSDNSLSFLSAMHPLSFLSFHFVLLLSLFFWFVDIVSNIRWFRVLLYTLKIL